VFLESTCVIKLCNLYWIDLLPRPFDDVDKFYASGWCLVCHSFASGMPCGLGKKIALAAAGQQKSGKLSEHQ
jgi:hypothetical protein